MERKGSLRIFSWFVRKGEQGGGSMSTEIMIHDYDTLVTAVWDDKELDDALLGTLKLEVVDTDEVYLVLRYDDKDISFYVSLQLLEAVLKKAKLSSPQYSEL